MLLEFVRRLKVRTGTLTTALGVAVAIAALLTYQRNHTWSSLIAIWEDSVAGNPQNGRSWFQMGDAYTRAGQCTEGAKAYERAATLIKDDYSLYINWALALDCGNKNDAAIVRLQDAFRFGPRAHTYAVLGMLHGKAGRTEQALAALDSAERLDAGFEMTYVYRGTIYYNARRFAEAAEQFRRAIAINPRNPDTPVKLRQAEAAAR
jgi:tetratricopeptide (TPR) repeat protein